MSLRPDHRSTTLITVAVVLATMAALWDAPAATADPYPLGVVTAEAGGDPGTCPAEHTCQRLRVVCPDVVDRTAYVAIQSPRLASPRGLVVFFAAGDGTAYWGDTGARLGMRNELRAEEGLESATVRWDSGWMKSGDGVRAGPVKVACRPASVARWIHDNLYVAPDVRPGPGRCGFCLSGSSGGAPAVTYPVTHFGADAFVDGVFPTGGPGHSAISRGCLRRRGDELYAYEPDIRRKIDDSYGYLTTDGPCTLADPAWAATWDRDAISTQGKDYLFEGTRFHVIIGQYDVMEIHQVSDLVERLETAGSPYLGFEVVPGMHHALDTNGVAALKRALAADGTDPVAACGNGLDDDRDGAADTADPGCTTALDASERDPAGPDCDNGTDDDGDGRRDVVDGGCSGVGDASERDSGIACDDGTDNDDDGQIDYIHDLGCTAANGTSESESGGAAGTITVTTPAVTVPERDPGQTTVRCSVGVRLSDSPPTTTTVSFATQPGSAAAGSDYVTKSGQLQWEAAATQLTKTINVSIVFDDTSEPQESFTVVLSNPTGGASLGSPSQATCTVTDDDAPPTGGSTITVTTPSVSVAEGDPGATPKCRITVRLSPASASTVTVRFATSAGTAGTGDYTSKSGTITFSAGQTSKVVAVSVTPDNADEADEAFTLTLSSPSGATLGSPSQATCTILDDD